MYVSLQWDTNLGDTTLIHHVWERRTHTLFVCFFHWRICRPLKLILFDWESLQSLVSFYGTYKTVNDCATSAWPPTLSTFQLMVIREIFLPFSFNKVYLKVSIDGRLITMECSYCATDSWGKEANQPEQHLAVYLYIKKTWIINDCCYTSCFHRQACRGIPSMWLFPDQSTVNEMITKATSPPFQLYWFWLGK